jgi:hypothetical protein
MEATAAVSTHRPTTSGRRSLLGVLVSLTGAVTVACGAPGGAAVTTTDHLASGSPGAAASTAPPLSVTTAGSPTLRTVPAQALPGEPFGSGPTAGQSLAVIGIAAGRTLAVRSLPGSGQPTLTTLAPVATGVVAAGRARLVGSTIWDEVTVRGVTGWAEAAHLAAPADTTDLTAEVVQRLGRRPVAETMLDLGTAVAQVYVSTEPPSTVTVSVSPSVGDLGEITVDVVGLGDDSVTAMRLHIFGTPGTESFTLKSVEGTPFCSRGVAASGRCV